MKLEKKKLEARTKSGNILVRKILISGTVRANPGTKGHFN